MAITDKTAIQNYLLTDIDASFNTQVDEWIASVEAYMNGVTDRILIASSTPSVYYYDVDKFHAHRLRIDEFVSITEVKDVDTDTAIDLTTLYMYPANAAYINRIDNPDNAFTIGRKKVKVTGIRGRFTQGTLPADLKFAATVLVAEIIEFSNPTVGAVKHESIGRYSVTYATPEQEADLKRSREIINSYRRVR